MRASRGNIAAPGRVGKAKFSRFAPLPCGCRGDAGRWARIIRPSRISLTAPAPQAPSTPCGAPMSQYIFTMNGVSKTVPPKRQIIKDISLSFFPGAKIGLLGLNGAGKSTVLKIMAGVDHDFVGEARPQPG